MIYIYSDTCDENKNDFEECLDNPYSPVSEISLTSLQESISERKLYVP